MNEKQTQQEEADESVESTGGIATDNCWSLSKGRWQILVSTALTLPYLFFASYLTIATQYRTLVLSVSMIYSIGLIIFYFTI